MIRVEFHFPSLNKDSINMPMDYLPRKHESVIFIDSEGTEQEYTVYYVSTVITPSERFAHIVLR